MGVGVQNHIENRNKGGEELGTVKGREQSKSVKRREARDREEGREVAQGRARGER